MRKKARELFASCRPIIVALCVYHEQIVNFLHLKHLVPVKLAEADAPGADLGKSNALQQHCFVLIALVSWNQVSSEMESLTSLSLYFTPSVMSLGEHVASVWNMQLPAAPICVTLLLSVLELRYGCL